MLSDDLVYVDWKCVSKDVIFSLRERYKDELPCLLQENFDELAENYAAEKVEDFLDALGQELTYVGCLLYEISTDSDSYALMLGKIDKEDELKAFLKANKYRGEQRKQVRRKTGLRAKRIELEERLPGEKFLLPSGYRVKNTEENLHGTLLLEFHDFSENRRFCSAVLNIAEWPPKQGPDINILIKRIATDKNGLSVATVMNSELNAQGRPADSNVKVLLGTDVSRIDQWQCIYETQNNDWSALQWFKDELFVADRNNVYHIKNLKKSKFVPKPVLKLEGGDIRWYPKFFVTNNHLYLYIHQTIYRWEGFRKFRPIYKIDGFNVSDFAIIGEDRVVFQVHPKYHVHGKSTYELTVLNLATMAVEKYPCQRGNVCKWKDNRVCVVAIEATSKMPLMECFDFDTKEKRCLRYGALGSELVHNVFETEKGTVIEGNQGHLYLTQNLWEFMCVEKFSG